MSDKRARINVEVKGEKQAQSKLGKLGDFIKARLVITIGDLINILKSAGRAVVRFISLATRQEDAVNSLNQALSNQGLLTQENTAMLQQQATELQKVTKYGDEQIMQLQAQLINYGLMPDQIEKATKATMDLAQGAFKGNLEPAMQAMAKTLGSQTNALGRYGVEVHGAVGSTDRLDSAVSAISGKFGGSAEAATSTFTGGISQLQNVLGDVGESLGQVATDALDPFIRKVTKWATHIRDNMNGIIAGTKIFFVDVVTEFRKNSVVLIEVLSRPFKWETYKALFDHFVEQIRRTVDAMTNLMRGGLNALRKIREEREQDERTAEERIADILEEAEQKKEEIRKKYSGREAKQLEVEVDQYAQAQIRKLSLAKKLNDELIAFNKTTSDALLSGESNFTKAYGEEIKKRLAAKIDAWAASEVAVNALNPFAIAMILAAQTAGKAALGSIQFAQGGQFERTNVSQTTGGQTAVDNERGLERVTVEPIGQPDSSSGRPIQVHINLNGKTLAKQLYPEIKAIERKIS
jgi:hypothetical protein